ncbi:MAG: hypothetical protein IJQ65_07220 [Kiritimatiellae bacterium]|nr:hypothetical protein [Kiritimatiellia bacterium]
MKNIAKSCCCALVAMAALCGVAVATPVDGMMPVETGFGWKDGWVAEWKSDVPGLDVRDTSARVRDGLVKVIRRWTWNGKEPLEKVTLSVRYRVKGDPKQLKPFMPGILMYGNPSNKGRTDGRVPVFAGEKGEFAIFEEHRLPMPFALLENANGGEFAAIHTLPSPIRGAVREDLWWSVGVEVAAGGTDIVILSGPIGYNRRRSVAKARQGMAMKYDETYVTLRPGQVVEKTFWIQTGKATHDSFGFEQAMDVSLDLFKPYRTDCYEPFERIFRVKRDYAMTRWMDERGASGFNMYDCGNGMTDVYERTHRRREIVLGWCGCAATCGYALPVLDIDKGDWAKAQKSLDFISDTFGATVRSSDGLFCVRYNMGTGKTSEGDPVSCGQALNCVVKAIRFAEKSGGRLNPAKWRTFAEKALDAIAASILKPDWQEPKSTNAGFLVAPLVAGSEIFGKKEQLAAAKKLAAVFERRYFGYEGVYWGGTLDAKCEDKEGAYAAFQGYAALLWNAVAVKDAAAERRYARLAQHAMNMMLTYTMVWDATYPPGRLSDHAFKSTGWTVVSAQNQHLDAFGVLTTPEIWRMGEYLKDDRLMKLAAVMYRSCFQLTDASGSLGEQIQHTNFGQRGDMSDVYRLRGGYAERWTVFWLTAHFLNAAAEFKEMGVCP